MKIGDIVTSKKSRYASVRGKYQIGRKDAQKQVRQAFRDGMVVVNLAPLMLMTFDCFETVTVYTSDDYFVVGTTKPELLQLCLENFNKKQGKQ